METKFSKAFTFTVTNFPKNSSQIISPPFSSGGCEWFVDLRGRHALNYLSLYLTVNEPKSLGLNWKRKARYYFVLLNQSREETYRTQESGDTSFCAEKPGRGWDKAFPLNRVLDKSVLVNDSFVIEIYIKVLEVVDENIDVNGFQVLPSHVTSVKQIFVDHPDIAKDFRLKNQVLKTAYMNVLLSLLETVKKLPKSITENDLSKAQSELCELTEVGFKLEGLKIKLEEIALENTEGFQIQKLEEQVKNLELNVSGLKVELDKEKEKSTSKATKVFSLEQKLSDLKIEQANEKARSEQKLSDLKTELDNEKAKSANYKSLKEAFSQLRVELEKEKAKSSSAAVKTLSLKEIWSGLKVKKDHKKGNSEITDNLLSWEQCRS